MVSSIRTNEKKLIDYSLIPKETWDWLESIGARMHNEPLAVVVRAWSSPPMHYSVKYLVNTPLDKIISNYEKHVNSFTKTE